MVDAMLQEAQSPPRRAVQPLWILSRDWRWQTFSACWANLVAVCPDMKRRNITIGYGIIGLWMIWPLIPVLIAGIVATSCGCKVDEGSVHPCIVFGTDIGGLLYTMSMMGWFALGTFPSGILALAVFSLLVWWRKRTADQEQNAETAGDPVATKQDLVLWLGLASILCSVITSVPALIIATRARPLATRAKVGTTVAIVTLVGNVVAPFALRLLRKD
jgi:hypothetical protein